MSDYYEFQVFDDPSALRQTIIEKNRKANRARLVAGYCWPWSSKKNKMAMDIEFPQFGFAAQWNLDDDGMLWAIANESVDQVGCIHTCQGLEFDYVGVIIGNDLVVRDGRIVTDATARAPQDRSVHGYKTLFKKDPEHARAMADVIIKNTDRTLMTRGQKGCFIYATDAETQAYFQSFTTSQTRPENHSTDSPLHSIEGYPFAVVPLEEAEPFVRHVPLYDLDVAAGSFGEVQATEVRAWVELPEFIRLSQDLFVCRVVGESMNKKIPNGSWCLFRANPGGTRNGKIVLVEHRAIADPDLGGSYTIKSYHSEKIELYGEYLNQRVVLKPQTNAFGYKDIVLEDDLEALKVIAEFLMVL